MLRLLLIITVFCHSITALSLAKMATDFTKDYYKCFNNMKVSGPIEVTEDGTLIENMIIIANPTSEEDHSHDFALKLADNVDDVTIRNVVVYHAANGRGIYGRFNKNLRIENVQVIAYGNAWGAQPCPTRPPFGGYDCTNIKLYDAENLKIHNVEVENGSKGISLHRSPGAELSQIVARNMRGPTPGGQCVQFVYSDDSVLDTFFCQNDIHISWVSDSVGAWRSSNAIVRNGVIEGNTSPKGMCVQFEGSEEGVHGGLIENVEARYCQGCFAGSPANGLYQTGNTCAAPICDPTEFGPREGRTSKVNFWVANDNARDGVDSANITVANSSYYKPCQPERGRLFFERRPGEIFANGGPDITELHDWTPKPGFKIRFDWDDCGLTPPDIDCSEFPQQEVASRKEFISTNHSDRVVLEPEKLYGACYPEEGF